MSGGDGGEQPDGTADETGLLPAVAVPPVTDPDVLRAVARERDAVPWRGWDVLPLALLYLVASVVVHLIVSGPEPEPKPLPLVDSGLLALASLLWLRLVRGRGAIARAWRLPGPGRPLGRTLLWALGVGIAAPVLDTALFALLEALGATVPPVQELLQEWVEESDAVWLLVIDIALVTPIAEELLFRGVFFQGLKRRWGIWPAAIASSVLFGAAHVESGGLDSVFLFVSTGGFGLAAAWLLERRRTLLAPIAAHMVVNAIGTAAFLAS